MAPETFFVQVGYQFYGGAIGGDNRTGSYLPVIHALRDDLTVLHVQDYNSGPVMGLDNQYHTMGGADFHIAMTDMLKAGFPVANTGRTSPACATTRSPSACRRRSARATATPPPPTCSRPLTASPRAPAAAATRCAAAPRPACAG